MLRKALIVLLINYSFFGHTQQQFFKPADSLNKGRLIGVSSGVGAVWSGSMIGLWQLWYKDAELTNWHSFDDSKNWLQMDKAGHFYTAYKLNQLNTDLFTWTGLDKKKSLWIGSGVSFGYQTTLEVLDARTVQWGFSWSDMLANTIGTVGYLSQQLAWNEERIIPKYSFAPTEFSSVRPNVLGNAFYESILKDYNGQTYWLSFSPGTFMKNDKFPKWACISLGYSAHEKLVGSEEYYLDPTTGIEYNSKREFLLSLDIDFSRIPVKKPWLKVLLKQLNYLKIPFPAMILREGKLIGSWTGF